MTETYDRRHYRRALRALRQYGLLLRTDSALPSVASLVAGEPVQGSWWAHPDNHDMYHVSVDLADHPDALVMKLISGKDTYVHRSLWPAIVALGTAREPWQLQGLSPVARRLLDAVTSSGELRTDDIPWTGGAKRDRPGEVARLLQRRLLVYGDQVHTERGAHAKRLETWERWAKRAGLARSRMTPERGRKELEGVLASLNERFQGKGRLPWERSRL